MCPRVISLQINERNNIFNLIYILTQFETVSCGSRSILSLSFSLSLSLYLFHSPPLSFSLSPSLCLSVFLSSHSLSLSASLFLSSLCTLQQLLRCDVSNYRIENTEDPFVWSFYGIINFTQKTVLSSIYT